ncbi:murein biosynthesis integral membrane protein MurJ, partial [Cellulomonas citrea]|uniref:murein biosynthesis integral membrane protein MurJ n=1 Tax=Cellulomonas citrea TaxID=1909423 RepID=UPI002E27FA1E
AAAQGLLAGRGLAGAAAMIAVVTAASRVLGLVRWLVQAHSVGAKAIGEAYTAANTVPNVLFEAAAGGALSGAVIPVLAEPIERGDRGGVQRIVSATLGWTLLVLVPLGLVLALAAGPVAQLLTPDAAQQRLARTFIQMFALQVPLYGLTVLAYAVLQAHKRFFWPAFAPILASVVTIAAYLWYGRLAGGELADPAAVPGRALLVLGWGTTAGVAAMCVPALVAMVPLRLRLRPTLRFPDGVAARVRRLALAGVSAVAAQQLSVLVMVVLAGRGTAEGTWPVYQYSQQVYLLPYAVLVVPLATSAFPRLSAWRATGDLHRFAALAAASLRGVLVVAGAGAAAVVAMAPAIALVFGEIRPEQAGVVVPAMNHALSLMVPGLVGFSLMYQGSRTLYALERGRSALVVNAIGWGTVTVAACVLFVAVGADGDVIGALSGASTIGMTVGGVAALVTLRRAAGPAALGGMRRSVPVLLGAGALAAVAGRWVVESVLMLVGAGVWSALGAALGGGFLALVVVAAVLAVGDRHVLTGLVHRDRMRPGGRPSATRRSAP